MFKGITGTISFLVFLALFGIMYRACNSIAPEELKPNTDKSIFYEMGKELKRIQKELFEGYKGEE